MPSWLTRQTDKDLFPWYWVTTRSPVCMTTLVQQEIPEMGGWNKQLEAVSVLRAVLAGVKDVFKYGASVARPESRQKTYSRKIR